jgi:hypothetical protein
MRLTVTAFCHDCHCEPHNGRALVNTPLSAQFCDSWLGFVEPNEHTLLSILRDQ